MFYRLIVRCDDNGRLDARPSYLRSMLFSTKQGVTEGNIGDAVNKLASVGLVVLYEAEGKPLLLFPKWGLHQRIRNVRGKYPAPADRLAQCAAAACGGARPESESESRSESNRKEGVHATFTPPSADEVSAYCRQRRNAVDAGHFVDFYASKGWKVGREPMRDWRAAVRTWERRDGMGERAPKTDGEANRRAREDMERMRAFLAAREGGHAGAERSEAPEGA